MVNRVSYRNREITDRSSSISIGMESRATKKVCVTGGAGYVGSMLIKKLLEKNYTVHATLRNLNDRSKVELLKNLPGADTRLEMFEADIYKPHQFEEAIEGCEYVFHVATPLLHTESSQYKDTTDAAVDGARTIASSCIKSGTVKRLIYTGSLFSASPLMEDGNGYKDFIDESCWTPLNVTVPQNLQLTENYTNSKTETEKEILKYGSDNGGRCNSNSSMEVVSLACGFIGGEGAQTTMVNTSIQALLSQLTGDPTTYQILRLGEEYMGKVPIVHIEDVCEAHIFCMEKPSINGRFLCANAYVSSDELAQYFKHNYPQFHVKDGFVDGRLKKNIKWVSTKLLDEGFRYKYDLAMALDDSIKFVRRLGYI